MRRLILLGATGYVGRAVRSAVPEASVVPVRDLACWTPRLPLGSDDVVVNCAGHVGTDASRLEAVNVALAYDAARRVADAGARLVHVSSMAVFDGIASGSLLETTPPTPSSPYGKSKWRAEQVVRDTLPEACVVRPAKVIGGDDPRRRLHALLRHVRAGRPLPVPRRPVLWANFVAAADVGELLGALALGGEAPPPVVHLTATVPWPTFVTLLERAVERPVSRLSAAPTAATGALARVVGLMPYGRRPRSAQRLLEIWDRQRMVDSSARLGADSLAIALADIARRAR